MWQVEEGHVVPRIAVTALNPMTGVDGSFAEEETALICPAVAQVPCVNIHLSLLAELVARQKRWGLPSRDPSAPTLLLRRRQRANPTLWSVAIGAMYCPALTGCR